MNQEEIQAFLQKNQHARILVIQTAFIGDVVLTTPMLKTIKMRMPGARLSVLVKPEAKKILESLSFIDEVLVIDKKKEHRTWGMVTIIKEIQKRNFDILLSPHISLRSSLIAFFSKAKIKIGYAHAALSSVYDFKIQRNQDLHEIHRLLDFLKQSLFPDLKDFPAAPVLEETPEGKQKAKELLKLFPNRPVAFACSSIWQTKRWTAWGFAELAGKVVEKYRSPVLLIGSGADYEISERIRTLTKYIYPEKIHSQIHNLCGQTDLTALYSLLRKCRFLVSNDSAPVHFGCAAGIPVIAIFGPTVKSFGYAPVCENSIVVEREGLYCRPCSTHGGRKCPEKHFRCMREITPDQVMEAISRLQLPNG